MNSKIKRTYKAKKGIDPGTKLIIAFGVGVGIAYTATYLYGYYHTYFK